MSLEMKSESTLFSCKLFTVKRISVSLPNGLVKNYELVDIQNAVTILPIDEDNNVLFVNQFRIGAKKSLLELPAGKIEDGEDPMLTAQRELREEIGMDANEIRPLGKFYMTPGYANEYMYCYLATGLFHSPLAPDADEFIKVNKIPLGKVFQMIETGEIEDSKTLACFMLAKNKI